MQLFSLGVYPSFLRISCSRFLLPNLHHTCVGPSCRRQCGKAASSADCRVRDGAAASKGGRRRMIQEGQVMRGGSFGGRPPDRVLYSQRIPSRLPARAPRAPSRLPRCAPPFSLPCPNRPPHPLPRPTLALHRQFPQPEQRCRPPPPPSHHGRQRLSAWPGGHGPPPAYPRPPAGASRARLPRRTAGYR